MNLPALSVAWRLKPLRTLVIRLWVRSVDASARRTIGTLPIIPALSSDLEQTYLSIQEGLERIAGISSDLVAEASDLVAMASGRETGAADFEQVLKILHQSLDFLSSASACMPQLTEELARTRATVTGTAKLESALNRTLAPLKFMHTMFRVESATLPVEAREIFVSLADEIGSLPERVQSCFGEQFAALFQVQSSLQNLSEAMERRYRDHSEKLAERRKQIQATLANMEAQVAENARRNIQLTEASNDFADAVNRAMFAMQSQDIVAQRLEHAKRGLAEAAQAITDAGSERDAAALGKVPTLARIEVAQIDAVIDELRRSEETLRAAFGKVTSRMGGLDEECLLLKEFSHLTVSVDGIVQILVDSLEALREMSEQTLDAARQHEQMLRPAEAAIGNLTNSVDEVARIMRRIALNAQIRAVQIGRETGLEVLASRTAEISRETLAISYTLTSDLDETRTHVTRVLNTLDRMREAGARSIETCNGDGAAEEANLHAFRDQTLERLRRFGALVKRAREAAQEVVERLDLSAPVSRLSQIREVVGELARQSEEVPVHASAAQAAGAERRYTMAGEREVHHKVLRELGAEAHADGPAEQRESNVELF